jgi:HK97 family phage major capsid protein
MPGPIDISGLIPETVSSTVLQEVTSTSAVMQMANRQTMATGIASMPVLQTLPDAGFVSGVGGRKPFTEIVWSSLRLVPEEIATTVAVPDAYIEDSGFPLWDEIRPRLTEAIARVIDDAVLTGAGAPASFPAGGVAGALQGTVDLAGMNFAQGVSEAMGLIEATGLRPNGTISDPTARRFLRGAVTLTGESLFNTSIANGVPDQLWGVPITYDQGGELGGAGVPLAIVGDWSKLIIGVRRDMTFDMTNTGVIADDAGKVLISAFQDDMTLMKVHMRLACVIGKVVTARHPTPINPFAGLTGTPSTNVAVTTSAGAEDADAEAADTAKAGK